MYVLQKTMKPVSICICYFFITFFLPALSQCNMRTDGVCKPEPVYKYVVGF